MKIVVSPLKTFSDDNSNAVQNIGLTVRKLEHCGIRTEAYLYNDFKGFTPKCHSAVKGKIDASFVLVIFKILNLVTSIKKSLYFSILSVYKWSYLFSSTLFSVLAL